MKQWRDAFGLTLEHLSAITRGQPGSKGLSPSELSRMETGKKPWRQDILEAYANALGCTPMDLLTRKPITVEEIREGLDRARKT